MRVFERGCVFIATVCVMTTSCMAGGGTIKNLKVTNETVYDLEVFVTGAERDGWVPLGRTRRGETTTHPLVDDVGDVWIFRFDSPGRGTVGEARIARGDLEADEWRMRVPDSVEGSLRRRGVEPSDSR